MGEISNPINAIPSCEAAPAICHREAARGDTHDNDRI